jgi:hypothetical protein
MARFYSNENFPRRVVEALRRLGHDTLTSFEAGKANQRIPDGEVLTFATEEKRALLTLNRLDFFRLHQSTNGQHSGIIACTRDDANPEAMAKRIHDAVAAIECLDGQVLRIVRPSL